MILPPVKAFFMEGFDANICAIKTTSSFSFSTAKVCWRPDADPEVITPPVNLPQSLISITATAESGIRTYTSPLLKKNRYVTANKVIAVITIM